MRAEYSPLVLTSPDAPDKRDGICPTYPTEDIKKTPNNRCLFGVSCFEEDSLDILHLSINISDYILYSVLSVVINSIIIFLRTPFIERRKTLRQNEPLRCL